jgi:FkbM family methyltransferase
LPGQFATLAQNPASPDGMALAFTEMQRFYRKPPYHSTEFNADTSRDRKSGQSPGLKETDVDYSLIVVGAHNGTRTQKLIEQGIRLGNVLLIEPVPWLFQALERRYSNIPNVHLLQAAISDTDAEDVPFFAPTESANDVKDFGDQLGSLNPSHAVSHNPKFSDKIHEIRVATLSFPTLLKRFDITTVDTLMTDTEGYDAKILAKFPFTVFKPGQIIFEFKHSDGVFHIGKNLAYLLVILEAHGYRTKVVDDENCVAVLNV